MMVLILQVLCALLLVGVGFVLNEALRARRDYFAALRKNMKDPNR